MNAPTDFSPIRWDDGLELLDQTLLDAATLALLHAASWKLGRAWISAVVVVCIAPLATAPWVLSASSHRARACWR